MTDEQDSPPQRSLRTPSHGNGMLSVGNPGNRGGGRPPDEFRRIMAEMASREDVLEYLEQCLKGYHGAKAAVAAHKHVTERGYGKEALPLNITELPAIVVKREG